MLRLVVVGGVLLGGCEWVFPLEPTEEEPPPKFGTPVPVNVGPLRAEEHVVDPSLDVAMTQIAFVRVDGAVAGSADIVIAGATGDPLVWTAPFVVQMSAPMQDERNAKLTADGLTMWFAVPTGSPVLRASSRTAAFPNVWTDVTSFETPGLTAVAQTRPGSVTPDGFHIVVHRENGGIQYLVEFERSGPGATWVEVADTMDAINAAGSAGNGHLTADALELVFTLQPTGAGNYDLYRARRAAPGMPFEAPTVIDELSSAMDDGDPWLSVDGQRIYFSRQFGGAPLAEWGIYYAER